ncbi:MDR family MFS transporter [Rhodococcus opacus]|uniref:Major facilitator superfamily multidrug resistance protein n=1 Tax=Rhodococcus opacus M213 TaxID=1129896 RepID=K8XQQ2_RHOOP|nr:MULTISPECIES: MDR family MFS transporter [Rhodococcus]ELB91429.1 major facilitator superfamily multidrug resistance protein [Rhodococcus wratislaviensis IFP 2016]NHU44575.1 MFS transporter [Rhodococcus sp. A14]EKT83151.1 major facilitator superfamily multidrug resistance protein [Rhodococcus opacus M213]MBA8958711.1 EmrB/QacA subfamily drug resistance transporter [Rhodococcus opacus]MBP2204276.1 EmrB/QacA subfamily drug resistance transporter [Rhodococcus opacus]
MATDTTPVDVGFRSERGPILVSLMLTTSLVALDATIISTAVFTIVGDLGGFSQFPWLFSIYLLTQAVSVPIYGKLADIFGRRPVMLLGIALFGVGSVLCGIAWSMPALIAFRAVQGLGAGAVQPMSMTIAGDIYTLAERAKAQGYLASVWGMSAVIGPTLGGVFSEYLSWRWIFFVNIPLCLLAAVMLIRNFDEKRARTQRSIDYAGAGILAVGATLLILGLLEGGQAWAWSSPISLGIFAAGVVFLIVFVLVERRAAEPVLPLWVFTRRVLAASSLVSLLVGAIVLGLTTYVPTFTQGVLGTGALVAGFALATLTIGWPIAASQSGRVYLRFGFRVTATAGSLLVVAGTALTLSLSIDSAVWQVAICCFVIGGGMGLVASPTLIAAQSSVDWSERGVVTSTNMFARSIGSAVGVALFGALVNARLGGADNPAPADLAGALHLVFVAALGAAVVLVVAAAAMPKSAAAPEAEPSAPTSEPPAVKE